MAEFEAAWVGPSPASGRLDGPGGTLRLDSDQREAQESGPSFPIALDSGPAHPATIDSRHPAPLEATYRDRTPQAGGSDTSRPLGTQRSALRRVGPYELMEEIGRGGMGSVYRARHAISGQVCAVKTLHHGGDEEDRQRFRREADLAWQLEHPGIVRVLDVGADRGVRFLVLELLTGGSLRERLTRQGPLPLGEAIQIGLTLADALSHAHQGGVLHRDLKPANVIFDGEGNPKLADFGLAQGPTGHSLTKTGSILGTPAFMAPEQARDSKRVDARTDVYGLGALLYAVISGRPPVVAASLHEALLALKEQKAPPLRSLRPEVSAELEAVFKRVLAPDPADRFQDVGAFAAALRAADPSRVGAPAEPRSRLLAVGGVALVIGGTLVGWFGAQSLSSGPSPEPSLATASPTDTSSPGTSPTPRPSPSASPPASPPAGGPSLDPNRPLSPDVSAKLAKLLQRQDTWEYAVTWSLDLSGDEVVVSAYLRHTPASSAPPRIRVDLLRLQACVLESKGEVHRFDSGHAARRKPRLLRELTKPRLLGHLDLTPAGRLGWTAATRWEINPKADPEVARSITERVFDPPLWRLWVAVDGLSVGAWGGEGERELKSNGLSWAAWRGDLGLTSLRRVKTHRVQSGVNLSTSHRGTWPAVTSWNGLPSANRVVEGELFEEPPFGSAGGKRVSLKAGTVVRLAPWGWPQARLVARRDVFAHDVEGDWRRVQWGASFGYVREQDVEPASSSGGWEILPSKVSVQATSQEGGSTVFVNGTLVGQRFVPTGESSFSSIEVHFDHRPVWLKRSQVRRVK